MSRDVLLGSTRRDWSRGSTVGVDLTPRAPEPTSESLLEAALAAPGPTRAPKRSVEKMVTDRLREGSPDAMRLYDELRPTYRDHKVMIRMKADPFKG